MNGFTIPITPTGRSSVVHGPPWHFSMECLQMDYVLAPDAVRPYLPPPLDIDDDAPGFAQLAFCDTSATSSQQPDLHVWAPADANFLECLLKVRCRLGRRAGFFVVISWVTNDQSLVRGYLQGFGKRLGTISMTRFDRLGNIAGGRFNGARLGARVSGADGVTIYGEQTCLSPGDPQAMPSFPFFLRRHVPSLDGSAPLIDRLVEPVVSSSAVADLWNGEGGIECAAGASDLGPLLPAQAAVRTRSFRTSLTITGSAEAKRE